MANRFDVVVLGMGTGGEVVSGRLLAAGEKVAIVERVIGGGLIGVETAQTMSHFGSQVTLIQHLERLINREDLKVIRYG